MTTSYTREEAAKRAENSRTNSVGFCQQWTRGLFNGKSAGDRDGDGDADAVDGWKSEAGYQHSGDRNPPRGTPVAFSGGRRGFGHRAISLGGGKIRSTDYPSAGRVGTTTIDWIEKNWGMKYLGWSETITGDLIKGGPESTKPSTAVPAKKTTPAKKATVKKTAAKKTTPAKKATTTVSTPTKAATPVKTTTKPAVKTSRGVHVDNAVRSLKKMRNLKGEKATQVKVALDALEKLPFVK